MQQKEGQKNEFGAKVIDGKIPIEMWNLGISGFNAKIFLCIYLIWFNVEIRFFLFLFFRDFFLFSCFSFIPKIGRPIAYCLYFKGSSLGCIVSEN